MSGKWQRPPAKSALHSAIHMLARWQEETVREIQIRLFRGDDTITAVVRYRDKWLASGQADAYGQLHWLDGDDWRTVEGDLHLAPPWARVAMEAAWSAAHTDDLGAR